MNQHTIYLIILMMLNINVLIAQPQPPRDGNGVATFSDEGIWHKNMELINSVNFNDIIGGEFYEHIKIGNDYYNVISIFEQNMIRIDRLTNPRSPELEVCKIHVGKRVEEIVLWESPTTHKVYAICNVETTINGEQAKAIIINLTEAINWLNSFNPAKTEIDLVDLNYRNKTKLKNVTPTLTNSNVYIGYIKANEYYFKNKDYYPDDGNYAYGYKAVHTLTLDRISSVLTFSHIAPMTYVEAGDTIIDGFIDTYLLSGDITGYNDSPEAFYGIEDHPDYSHTSNFVVPTAFKQDGTPIRFTRKNENTTWPEEGAPHETHVHKKKAVDANGNPIMDMMNPSNNYVPNTISMNIAAFGTGHVVIDVDYSDPFDCQVDYVKKIPFNKDLEKFNKELKQIYDRQLINIEFEDYKNKVINQLIYIEYLKEISKIDYKKNKNIQNIGETYEYSYQVEQEYENYSKKHYEGYIKFRDRYFDITK